MVQSEISCFILRKGAGRPVIYRIERVHRCRQKSFAQVTSSKALYSYFNLGCDPTERAKEWLDDRVTEVARAFAGDTTDLSYR